MACAAEMGVAESDYSFVVILISGAVLVGARLVFPLDIVRNHIRIGRNLHSSEWDASPREGMPHTGSADERVYILCMLSKSIDGQAYNAKTKEKTRFHIFKYNTFFPEKLLN
jgi:hypothetical protein